MLNTNSRYTTTSAVDGNIISVRKFKPIENYSLYTVRSNDTMDSIAVAVYGDPSLYWRIADMNPQIQYPDSLQVGDILRIPS
jgi:nucleoid-associated protein YgaU